MTIRLPTLTVATYQLQASQRQPLAAVAMQPLVGVAGAALLVVLGVFSRKPAAGRLRSEQRSTQPVSATPAVPGDTSTAATSGGERNATEEPEHRQQAAAAVAAETSGLLQPAIGGSIGTLQLPRWREWTGQSEGGSSSEEGAESSSPASVRSSGDSSHSGSSDGCEAAGSHADETAVELTPDAIDKAAWGCLVAEDRSQDAVWERRAAEAQAAAQAAAAAGNSKDWLCCRDVPRNLRSLALPLGGTDATAGLELMVPDWWHGKLGAAEVRGGGRLHAHPA